MISKTFLLWGIKTQEKTIKFNVINRVHLKAREKKDGV